MNFEINNEISSSDIIITDYSSALFEGSELSKKVILDFSDFNYFNRIRGVYNNVLNDLYFEKVYDVREVFSLLEKKGNFLLRDIKFFESFFSEFDFVKNKNSWINELINSRNKVDLINCSKFPEKRFNINLSRQSL